jgi:hypothetical protein
MDDIAGRHFSYRDRPWIVWDDELAGPNQCERHYSPVDDGAWQVVISLTSATVAPVADVSDKDLCRQLEAALRRELRLLTAAGERWEVRLNGMSSNADGVSRLGVDFRCRRTGRVVHGDIAEDCYSPMRMSAEELRECLSFALQIARRVRAVRR